MLCRQQYDERIKASQKHRVLGQGSPFQIETVQSRKLLCFYGGKKSEGMERTILQALFFHIGSSKFMEAFKIMRSKHELEAERVGG